MTQALAFRTLEDGGSPLKTLLFATSTAEGLAQLEPSLGAQGHQFTREGWPYMHGIGPAAGGWLLERPLGRGGAGGQEPLPCVVVGDGGGVDEQGPDGWIHPGAGCSECGGSGRWGA